MAKGSGHVVLRRKLRLKSSTLSPQLVTVRDHEIAPVKCKCFILHSTKVSMQISANSSNRTKLFWIVYLILRRWYLTNNFDVIHSSEIQTSSNDSRIIISDGASPAWAFLIYLLIRKANKITISLCLSTALYLFSFPIGCSAIFYPQYAFTSCINVSHRF